MKKIAMLLSIVMMVALAMTTFAAEEKTAKMETLAGKVLSVDSENGKIVIMSNDKENTLQAQPKMLEGISAGQSVKIEKVANEVKSIKIDNEVKQKENVK